MMPDRCFNVPPGSVVRTGYVDIFKCRLANRERMAVGDVDRSYQRLLQLGKESQWPFPKGHWEGDTFVIEDGRHEYVASIMLGREYILVAWVEALPAITALVPNRMCGATEKVCDKGCGILLPCQRKLCA